MKIKTFLLATALFLPITTFAKTVTVTVIVPATASGNFGGSGDSNSTALVKAITVTKATTIKISHVDGEWRSSNTNTYPYTDANGHDAPISAADQLPLQQVTGVRGSAGVTNSMALIGAFIPKALINSSTFTPVDGTKKSRGLGIMPDKLFFVGTDNVIQTNGAGTLYLGVNDCCVGDNSGSLTIEVTTP
jgi:hypothetical protein